MDKSKDNFCEIMSVDGCKIIMRFAPRSNPNTIARVKNTLFQSEHTLCNSPEICNTPGILV